LPELSQTLFIKSYVFQGPWCLHADAAEPDELGQLQLRKRLEDPSGLLKRFSPGALAAPNSHYIAFDAESLDEYRSIVRGQTQLSAILMQGLSAPNQNMDDDLPFSGNFANVWEVTFYWLAVIFRDRVAKRVGVIRSNISLGYGLNRRGLKYGVCKLG
jgi:hypothetical protein